MKQCNVKITNKALAYMDAIYTYIADELLNSDAAIGQYNRIANAIESLKVFPERRKIFSSQPERDLGMHQIFADNYTAIYVIREDDVVVLRVLYSASDINARLLEDI